MHQPSLRSVASWLVSPSADPVVGSNEVFSNQNGIVAVGDTPDHLSIDVRPTIAAAIVGAQWVGEGARGHGQKRRREWSRGSFGVESISSIKEERRLRLLC